MQEAEKEAKYHFITKEVEKVIQEVQHGKLSFDQYPGAYVYLLLGLIYKLDYLTRPEGYLMERLEFAHRQYFAKDNKTTLEKAKDLVQELQKLLGPIQRCLF